MSLEILYNYEKNHIKNKGDALVCCMHFSLISNGYKCIAKGEEVPRENVKPSDMMPPGWSADEIYALMYKHERTGDTFLLKIIKFDCMLLVHFLRTKDEKVSSMEVKPSDYVARDLSSYSSAFLNLGQFQKRLDSELLIPFDETQKTASSKKPVDLSRADPKEPDPTRVPHHPPEWQQQQQSDPFLFGQSDLDPLASGMGGGMVFDPMRSGFPSRGGLGGIDGTRLPRGAVPPGARFDPFGPPDVDPRGSMHPGYRNQRSGPDPDHLPPPGYDDMFM